MISLKLFLKCRESFLFGELFYQNNATRKIFGERGNFDKSFSDSQMSHVMKIRSRKDSERMILTDEKIFLPGGTFDYFWKQHRFDRCILKTKIQNVFSIIPTLVLVKNDLVLGRPRKNNVLSCCRC